MKIRVELDVNEMDSLKKLVRTALKCAKSAGLDMDISISKQVENVSMFVNGILEKEFDSFVVWTSFDGLTAIIDRFGVWAIQTLRMVKDLGKITAKYDRRIKYYLEYTKNMND